MPCTCAGEVQALMGWILLWPPQPRRIATQSTGLQSLPWTSCASSPLHTSSTTTQRVHRSLQLTHPVSWPYLLHRDSEGCTESLAQLNSWSGSKEVALCSARQPEAAAAVASMSFVAMSCEVVWGITRARNSAVQQCLDTLRIRASLA